MRTIFATGTPSVPALTTAYDRAATTWHRTISKFGFLEAYGDLLADAADRLPRTELPLRVLDAGSGTAGFSVAFARRIGHAEFDLLDLSSEMLAKGAQTMAAEGMACNQICCDVSTLTQRRKRYDVVLSAHLIEHIDDAVSVLADLRSVLAPGGLVVLAVSKPHWCTALVRLRWKNRAYQPQEMRGLLELSGFEDIETFAFSSGPPSRLSAGYIASTPKGDQS